MPWKLILYILILGVILVFVGLNIGNQSDISFGFVVFEDVPVFLSLFAAFFVGVIVALPVAVYSASRKARVGAERRLNKQIQREERASKKRRPGSDPGSKTDGAPTVAAPEDVPKR